MHRRPGGATTGQAVTLRFTEEMKGHVIFGEWDPRSDRVRLDRDRAALLFHVTIVIDSLDRFIADPRHEGTARGRVRCEELGGRLAIERGVFNLFVEEGDPERRRMLYLLHFRDDAGRPLTLAGYKTVVRRHLPPFDVWPDTTTLFTRILRGFVDDVDDAEAEVVAAGVLRISMLAFGHQLCTFRTQGPTRVQRLRGLAGFGALFAGELWRTYISAPRSRRLARS